MLFRDNEGKILTLDEVNNIDAWEITERGIHTDDIEQNNTIEDYTEFS